jgi:hypothetical protein
MDVRTLNVDSGSSTNFKPPSAEVPIMGNGVGGSHGHVLDVDIFPMLLLLQLLPANPRVLLWHHFQLHP